MKEHYKGLGHIAIYTADMEQSIAFYENIGGSVFKRDGVQTPDGEKKRADRAARRHARAVRRGQHSALRRLR